MQLFWKEKKKGQMISFINTDLAKGRGKTPNKQTNKNPKRLYTVGKQTGILFRCKKCVLRLLLTDFSCIKDPKHVVPPEKKTTKNKITRTECPKEEGLSDRNLQS